MSKTREAQSIFCWLIENGKQAGQGLAYRRMEQGLPIWTEDANKALWFVRREDAEAFAEEDREAERIVEHGFHTPLKAEPEQEPVAFMFQHEDTGRMQCVDAQQVEWGFEKANPRLKKIAPLYTSPQPREWQEPCAMRYDFDGYGWKYIDSGSGSDWQTRIKDAEPVYAKPQPLKAESEQEPVTMHEVAEERDKLMQMVQEYASTWAIVGGRFDDGSALEDAKKSKDSIFRQTAKLATISFELGFDKERGVKSLPQHSEPKKLWLWKNFVGGKAEYWAFENAYPIHIDNDDPQVIGEPCGYALYKPSRNSGVNRREPSPVASPQPLKAEPEQGKNKGAKNCMNCVAFGECHPNNDAGRCGYDETDSERVPVAPHTDDIAIDKFADTMKMKMGKQRAKGYGGWDNKAECSPERLQQMLFDHLAKGDPVDVGIFAMMLWNRGELTKNFAPKPREWQELSDVEWMNIVNKDRAWCGYDPSDVANEVFNLTSAALRTKNEGKA